MSASTPVPGFSPPPGPLRLRLAHLFDARPQRHPADSSGNTVQRGGREAESARRSHGQAQKDQAERSRLHGPLAAPASWTHADSDLPVDPRIQFFELDNGLRVAWARQPRAQRARLRSAARGRGLPGGDRGRTGHGSLLGAHGLQWFRKLRGGHLDQLVPRARHERLAPTPTPIPRSQKPSISSTCRRTRKSSVREGLTVLRDFASRLD